LKSKFNIGDQVLIRQAYPPGHIRTPYFIRGRVGKIVKILGEYANPEELAYGRNGQPLQSVYSIKFLQKDLWLNYSGMLNDTVIVEVMENWLEKHKNSQKPSNKKPYCNQLPKHSELSNAESSDISKHVIMAKAVEQLLIKKGLISSNEMKKMIEKIDSQSPAEGARLVARSWIDPDFKARMLNDFRTTAQEIGIDIGPIQIIAIENTNILHNAIVCTLCSCYPKFLIGLPPEWYKSKNYRSRMIFEPRTVLAEFGTKISDKVELRIYDSTAELRYMILPMQPKNVEGLDENALAGLVTRDAMIGTSIIKSDHEN
jgi:nitrile hydratase